MPEASGTIDSPPILNIPPREGMLIQTEVLDPDCIKEVICNPQARDQLDASNRYITEERFLRNNVMVSVPFDRFSKTTGGILAPVNWGRSVSIGYGKFIFDSMIGRILSGKGGFISGEYTKSQQQEILSQSHTTRFHGLLSVEGAKWDMIVSNALNQAGARSSLVTGIVVLDAEKYKKWLLKRWSSDIQQQTVHTSFEIFSQKYKNPAYMFRIGGTLERHMNILGPQADNRKRWDTVEGMKLMREESLMDSSRIGRAMNMTHDPRLVGHAMDSMTHPGIRLSEEDFYALEDFFVSLSAQNASAIPRASRMITDGYLTGYLLAVEKDVDYAWYSYDYDAAHMEAPRSEKEIVDGYLDATATLHYWAMFDANNSANLADMTGNEHHEYTRRREGIFELKRRITERMKE